jgi:tetratricopeptide (TPR) repeat protein
MDVSPDSTAGPNPLGDAEQFDRAATQFVDGRQFADAAAYYRRALRIRKQLLGSEHWEVAHNLVLLGGVLVCGGNREEARTHWGRAAAIYELQSCQRPRFTDGGVRHILLRLASVLNDLAVLAYRESNWEEAEQYFRRLFAACPGAVAAKYRPFFAQVLLQQKKYEEAQRVLQEVIAEPRAPGRAGGRMLLNSVLVLTRLYVEQGLFADADLLFREALGAWDAHPDWHDYNLVHIYRAYGDLCRKTGREADAKELEARAAQTSEEGAR